MNSVTETNSLSSGFVMEKPFPLCQLPSDLITQIFFNTKLSDFYACFSVSTEWKETLSQDSIQQACQRFYLPYSNLKQRIDFFPSLVAPSAIKLRWTPMPVVTNGGMGVFGCADTKEIKVLDLKSNTCIHSLKIEDNPSCFTLSESGRILAFLLNNNIQIWDLEKKECLATSKPLEGRNKAIAVSCHGTLYLGHTISGEARIQAWDWKTDTWTKEITTWTEDTQPPSDLTAICSFVFSKNQELLFAGSPGGRIMVLDCTFDGCIAEFKVELGYYYNSQTGASGQDELLSLALVDEELFLCSHAGSIRTLDWQTRATSLVLDTKTTGSCAFAIAKIANEQLLFLNHYTSSMQVWNLGTGRCIATFDPGISPKRNLVRSLFASHDGKLWFADGSLLTWDFNDNEEKILDKVGVALGVDELSVRHGEDHALVILAAERFKKMPAGKEKEALAQKIHPSLVKGHYGL
jgi:WD40 repeat protein